MGFNFSNKGLGENVAVAFSSGLFGGVGIQGAVLGPRSGINETYYGRSLTPALILFEDAVQVPEGTLMPQIYEMLDKLMAGNIDQPTTQEANKTGDADTTKTDTK